MTVALRSLALTGAEQWALLTSGTMALPKFREVTNYKSERYRLWKKRYNAKYRKRLRAQRA